MFVERLARRRRHRRSCRCETPGPHPGGRAAGRLPGLRARARPRRRVGGGRRAAGAPRAGTVNAVDLGGHRDRRRPGRSRWGRLYAGDPIDDLDAGRARARSDGLRRPHRVPTSAAGRRVAGPAGVARPPTSDGSSPAWARACRRRPRRGGRHAPTRRPRSPRSPRWWPTRPTTPCWCTPASARTGPSWWPPLLLSARRACADADLPFFPTRGRGPGRPAGPVRLGRRLPHGRRASTPADLDAAPVGPARPDRWLGR